MTIEFITKIDETNRQNLFVCVCVRCLLLSYSSNPNYHTQVLVLYGEITAYMGIEGWIKRSDSAFLLESFFI